MARRTLLLLGAGPEQAAAMRVARALGHRVLAFDNQARPASAGEADDFLQVDLKDDAALLAAAQAAGPDGVFCHAAELAVPVAKVAEALGLPGIGVETAMRATDKRLRAAALSAAGVETPRFRALDAEATEAEWLDAYEALGPEVVCKPPDLAGARGVEIAGSGDEVLSYRSRRGGVGASAFLMEAYVEGPQISSESVILEGRVAATNLARRHYDTTRRLRPHPIEDGHSMPSGLPPEVAAEIDAVTARCAAALGLRDGVLKGDLILAGGRIVVLEMAARTSGGRFADLVAPRATGVAILPPLIQLAMGDAPDLRFLEPRANVGVSQRFIWPEPGRRLSGLARLAAQTLGPHVLDVVLHRDAFDGAAMGPVKCHGDRAGYVVCSGATRDEADARALAFAAEAVAA